MKNIISNIIFIASFTLIFSSCSIEGEDVSGIWFTNGALGKMKIEVKPSKGKFVGYLLEFEENGKMKLGGIDKKFLIFRGLRFNIDKYDGGSFLKSPKSANPCELKLAYNSQNKKSMKVAYKCDGFNRLEYWKRDGYPDKPVITSRVSTISLDELIKANPNNKDN